MSYPGYFTPRERAKLVWMWWQNRKISASAWNWTLDIQSITYSLHCLTYLGYIMEYQIKELHYYAELEIQLSIHFYKLTVKNINCFIISMLVTVQQKTRHLIIYGYVCYSDTAISKKAFIACMHATVTVTWKDDYFNLKLKTITITLTNLKISKSAVPIFSPRMQRL